MSSPSPQNKIVFNTLCSQAVTHPSTNWARRCLASVIGRELAFSTWYGRRQLWWLILAVLCLHAAITNKGMQLLFVCCMFIVLLPDILTCFFIWQPNHSSPSSIYLTSIIEHIFLFHKIVSMQFTFSILIEDGLVGLPARFDPCCRVCPLIGASFGFGLFANIGLDTCSIDELFGNNHFDATSRVAPLFSILSH